jgi:hypothetical protein
MTVVVIVTYTTVTVGELELAPPPGVLVGDVSDGNDVMLGMPVMKFPVLKMRLAERSLPRMELATELATLSGTALVLHGSGRVPSQ